ncbi:hypothetical protein VNO80_03287 [Phaseolus coccineus]|uniref:Uncharacterized protein n=1 Tax=Phaseolus coccineus TaxID=3886 RepID=A0AAN9RMY0_PHACN
MKFYQFCANNMNIKSIWCSPWTKTSILSTSLKSLNTFDLGNLVSLLFTAQGIISRLTRFRARITYRIYGNEKGYLKEQNNDAKVFI